ncbi:MAG: hypothetical protein GEV28_06360 [Actinophytocola sp.]|uniref:hypothetical protein n=1 Tax=Actinophytocola sp. TaxID=1872138 RepID=UPI0013266C2F|nr:hypothetical protein [Actinophytocola sp.]MPZ80028.1 hypothetical protein [Actinophytocola sp.]
MAPPLISTPPCCPLWTVSARTSCAHTSTAPPRWPGSCCPARLRREPGAADLAALTERLDGAGRAVVDTRDHLRPTFVAGRLVLLVEPAAGGVLRPAEIEEPHQCCGGH